MIISIYIFTYNLSSRTVGSAAQRDQAAEDLLPAAPPKVAAGSLASATLAVLATPVVLADPVALAILAGPGTADPLILVAGVPVLATPVVLAAPAVQRTVLAAVPVVLATPAVQRTVLAAGLAVLATPAVQRTVLAAVPAVLATLAVPFLAGRLLARTRPRECVQWAPPRVGHSVPLRAPRWELLSRGG